MPRVTKHGMKRMMQRTGIGKHRIQEMATRVYRNGITHAEATNDLKGVMNSLYNAEKKANNMRFYGNCIYVFKDDILITVIKAPEAILNNLENNVKTDAYLRYINNKRSKYRRSLQNKKFTQIT